MADSDRIIDLDLELQNMRGTFSQLLFADDPVGLEVASSETANLGSNPSYLSPYSKQDLTKMLSFGNLQVGGNQVKAAPPEPTVCRIDPRKSTSCSSDISPKYLPKCMRREEELVQSSSNVLSTTSTLNKKSSKRRKFQNTSSTSNSQSKPARRLGEGVAALQQLVSPYGKTDTASVLHEAMGYIRFLHEQVWVLCSPYLQQFPSPPEQHEGQGNRSEEPILNSSERSLRSRGLCLVPVGCMVLPVAAACSGADFWSPALCNGKLSPSSPHHG